mgnify:CR=1 FL=1
MGFYSVYVMANTYTKIAVANPARWALAIYNATGGKCYISTDPQYNPQYAFPVKQDFTIVFHKEDNDRPDMEYYAFCETSGYLYVIESLAVS